jgi:hypothetical protein
VIWVFENKENSKPIDPYEPWTEFVMAHHPGYASGLRRGFLRDEGRHAPSSSIIFLIVESSLSMVYDNAL